MTAAKNDVSTAIMFYMSAQNELSIRADEDIAEIKSAADFSDIAFYIMLDTQKEPAGGGKLVRNTFVWNLPPVVSAADFALPPPRPDADAVDNRVFGKFLGEAEDAFQTFNTRQRILVLWGHGGGMVMLDQDEARGEKRTQASVVDFADALERRSRSAADPLRFDVIAFDSCYMGVIETMHQFRGLTDFALVSSTVVDSSGYPYRPIVGELQAKGHVLDPRLAAEMFCREYNQHYQQLGKLKRRYLFACDTSKAGACVGALNALGKVLAELFGPDPANDPVRAALDDALLAARATASYVGVLVFIKKLLDRMESVVAAPALELLSQRSAALVENVHAAFHGPLGDSGMVPTSPLIWCPVNINEFKTNLAAYTRLDASSGGYGGWISMLYKYHNLKRIPLKDSTHRSKFETSIKPSRSPTA